MIVARPVYAPALVAWVGGPRFGIGIEVGRAGPGVAWFPLGPREVYVPPYRVSRTYVTNVNVTNTVVNNTTVTNVYNNYTTNNTSVTNIKYMNRTAPGAITATSQTAFASGQPVSRNLVRVDERQLAREQITPNVGVVPEQRSVLGGAATSSVRPSAAVQARSVVARTAPPPAPVAFARQQQVIQSNGGRPLGRQEMQRLEPERAQGATAVKVVRPQARPVPVESVARTRPGGQPAQSNRPAPAALPAPEQPVQPNQRIRQDRPPSAQPNRTPLSSNPNENRPVQPPLSPRDAELGRKQQQDQQRLQQQQQQEQQRLEQKHRQEELKAQQQAENQRQQQEHQKLQQKQQQELQKLEQKQTQQREKVQKQETKQQQRQRSQKSREDRPPRN